MPVDNQIRREDIAYKLSKALEIRGHTPGLDLDTTVIPVVVVEDLTAGNEQDYQIHRWVRGRGSSPAAAQFGKLSFNNQLTSGVLVRVYQVAIFHDGSIAHPSGVAGGIIGMTIEAASTGGTQINFTKQYSDSRLDLTGPASPGRLPSVDIRYDNSGGLAGHMARFWVPVTGIQVQLGGWTIHPGTRLHFEALDVNCEFNVSAEWTETNL